MSNEPLQTTVYIPVQSPPTPSPSTRPSSPLQSAHPGALARILNVLPLLTPAELLILHDTITPLLKRDFISNLPVELSLSILGWIEDPASILSASLVCRRWAGICADDSLWRNLSISWGYNKLLVSSPPTSPLKSDMAIELEALEPFARLGVERDPALEWIERNRMVSSLAEHHVDNHQTMGDKGSDHEMMRVSWKEHFRYHYVLSRNWQKGGHLLRAHRVISNNPASESSPGTSLSLQASTHSAAHFRQSTVPASVVTSCALGSEWLVVGLSTAKVQVYSAKTGVLARTLIGHSDGVWCVALIQGGGAWDEPYLSKSGHPDSEQSPPSLEHTLTSSWLTAVGLAADGSGACVCPDILPSRRQRRMTRTNRFHPTEGWGIPSSLVLSAGCDKLLKLWDVRSGHCIYTLHAHTSTIRCLKAMDHSPIVVSGSRDGRICVWDIQRGALERRLEGHEGSVRCLDLGWISDTDGGVPHRRVVVSGSYDTTCRIWDLESGTTLHVLRGHFHQVYCVALDNSRGRVISGSLDSTIRVWDVFTGQNLALLQGHTSLITNLQLLSSPSGEQLLLSSSSAGHIIMYSLHTYLPVASPRTQAHDGSVTTFHAGRNWLVTGGHDGRVRIWSLFPNLRWVRDVPFDGTMVHHGGGGLGKRSNVWKVAVDESESILAIMGVSAGGRTCVELWDMKPKNFSP